MYAITFLRPCLRRHAFELIITIGGILAFDHGPSFFEGRQTLGELVSLLGVAMIIVSCFIFTDATPWPSYHALLPCMGTVFFIWASFNNKPKINCSDLI